MFWRGRGKEKETAEEYRETKISLASSSSRLHKKEANEGEVKRKRRLRVDTGARVGATGWRVGGGKKYEAISKNLIRFCHKRKIRRD